MVKKNLFLGICLLLIVSLLGAFHTPALAAPEASITLNPTEELSGTVVTVSGSGFASSSTITVNWNGEAMATDPETVTTDGTGSFNCEITVPDTSHGEYSVVATDSETNSAEATFYVLPSDGEKIIEGIYTIGRVMIALPAIINEIANDFFDVGHLRFTDSGNEFVANVSSILSDGAEYAAQWMEEKLGE